MRRRQVIRGHYDAPKQLISAHRRRKIHEQILVLMKEGKAASVEVRGTDLSLLAEAKFIEQQERRSLCTELHGALPRELRDMIYDYVLDTTAGEFISCDFKRTSEGMRTYFLERKRGGANDASSYTMNPLDQFWWREEHMGAAVAREVVERWYQTRRFVLRAHEHRSFQHFLTHDPIGKALKPFALVKKLSIKVFKIATPAAGTKDNFLMHLQDLQVIRNKGAYIEFTLASASSAQNHTTRLKNFLQLVGPAVHQLREGGFQCVHASTTYNVLLVPLFNLPKNAFNETLVRQPELGMNLC
jgi:hypothetical protein